MKYTVLVLSAAEEDVVDIFDYISITDSVDSANYIAEQIQKSCCDLACFPNRGHCPLELEQIGILNFKEVHFKPYRIIYEVIDCNVFIHAILDGKRSLQRLLERRLIR